MKKWFNKMKTNFKNATKGFSLVELIVVIAIMAVMAAVLAPALLGYVERSRAQKDDSAMGEVTNAIQLSLADMDVYDEALQFAVKDNYSCYADGDASTNTDANKIVTKSPDLWLFNNQARLLDETVYKPAGKMRGVTITLKPNGKAEYILKDGIINKIGDDSTKKGVNAGKILNDCPEIYNRLRSTVGDTVKVSSQTYRNSDYTIFISMGTTGGNQADKQDAIQVYGQYNGTNLPEVATPVAGGSQSGAPSEDQSSAPDASIGGVIPEGAIYKQVKAINWYCWNCSKNTTQETCESCGETCYQKVYDYETLNAGTAFPENTTLGDMYITDNYEYRYGARWCNWEEQWSDLCYGCFTQCEWAVKCTKNTSEPGEILQNINNKPITSMFMTFYNCTSMTKVPDIPDSVTDMASCFYGCRNLVTAPDIPDSVTNMNSCFQGCTNLVTAPDIPSTVNNIGSLFYDCKSLEIAPNIPSGIPELSYVFCGCESLRTYKNSNDDDGDFSHYIIPSSATYIDGLFHDCKQIRIAPTISNDVTSLYATFAGCTSLTSVPRIPAGVTYMSFTFDGCSSLTEITVDANPRSYSCCLRDSAVTSIKGNTTMSSRLLQTKYNQNIG